MEELKRLIEALGRTFEQFKAENDSRIKAIEAKGHADPLLVEKVEKINADISQIGAMKRQLELVETAVARAQFGGGGGAKSPEAMNRLKAFSHLMRRGAEAIKEMEVQAAASTLSDPDGGFTVPEEVDAAIDRVAGTISAMRRLCTVRSISTDTYKKLVSQGGATSGWVAEKGTRAETDTPTLKEIAINTKELYAMPYATQTLLDDSAIDIGAWLADEVSIEFDEEEGDSFINGDGVGQPKGIGAYTMIANSSYAWGKIGFTVSGHASTMPNFDKLITLQHTLKPRYRNGASFLMNDDTCEAVRKFKDGEGRYLWQPSVVVGQPDVLLGKPVEYDDNVASITNNTFPIWYGNFKRAYMIVDRLGTRVLRDPYTAKPYVAFYTTKRVGGGIIMYEALKALKISA